MATSIYVMLDKGVAYEYGPDEKKKEQLRNSQIKNLKKKLKQLNITEEEIKEMIGSAAAWSFKRAIYLSKHYILAAFATIFLVLGRGLLYSEGRRFMQVY